MSAKKATQHEDHNPKTDPEPGSNAIKDPENWTTGGEPMTGAQASYLKTLSEEAGADAKEGYADGLTKAEASQRIDALRVRTGKGG